jgi:aspartate kinase
MRAGREARLQIVRGIKVMKFGGTSVATPEARMTSAMRVISAREQGFRPVVVVSAIGRRGAPYATDTLVGMLREIDPNVDPEPRELDLLAACGEILSAVIFAHTLKTLGHPALTFRGGQAGIRTDGVYGNARIVGIIPVSLQRAIDAGKIPVVCGFQGVYVAPDGGPGGELTTLGRGGSDTTASAIGAALGAEAVEIFTDVDGVKTADPDAVPDAPTLRKVTYDEVAEIAHLGAKVVHPRAAEIAMNYGIPLWVKNTFTDDEGTEILPRERFPGRRVTGVTHTGKLVHLQFDLHAADERDRVMLESRIYETMARYGVNLYMLNVSPSSTGFAVSRHQYPIVENVLDGLVVPNEREPRVVYVFQIGHEASREVETQADLLRSLGEVRRIGAQLTEGCTMVSLVGHEYMQQAGVFYAVLSALAEGQVTVLQTSDSDFSLSCLVPEAETNRAVRLLHERFGLEKVV